VYTAALLAVVAASGILYAQKPENVLVVVNQLSPVSRSIGEYYVLKRGVPLDNLCRIRVAPAEEISRLDFARDVAAPVARYLQSRRLTEKILYLVTTSGVPLRIAGDMSAQGDLASVDSELALLYSDLHGRPHALNGPLSNPFFGKRSAAFRHPDFPIYLVTRLTGYDFADVKNLIDRALAAKNRGKFVIDLKSASDEPGNDWLRSAAAKLPKERVALDESTSVLYGEKDVIGYAAWGSNDPHRTRRLLGFTWLPGAIMTEYVSTNARTFRRPPEGWNIGNWGDRSTWFDGSPQTMTADYIHEGVTGASGHVGEPYLMLTPRPDYLLPAYFEGRNLAESYYLSMPALSWRNIVVGDPLCAIGKP
jgi:uncharacterized protein (TIGR03790 family)